MIIPYSEIQEILNGSYIDNNEEILVKHSVYKGEREFALVLIEQCMCLLNRQNVNDKFIIQYLQGLLALTVPGNNHYKSFLNTFVTESTLKENALSAEKLSVYDIAVLKELMQTNMAEYTMKGEYQKCCYSAMAAFFQTAYCILEKKFDFYIKHIDIIADLDDELDSIQVYESANPTDVIIVDWHSTNKINSIYMLYRL